MSSGMVSAAWAARNEHSVLISATIRDYFDDIRLGRVTFEPFEVTPIADAGPQP